VPFPDSCTAAAAFCSEVAPLLLLPHPLFDADIVAAKTFGSTGS